MVYGRKRRGCSSFVDPPENQDMEKLWIGLRENLQENPIFNGKIYGFRLRFSQQNQSIDGKAMVKPKEHVLKQLVLHIYVCLLEGNKHSTPKR